MKQKSTKINNEPLNKVLKIIIRVKKLINIYKEKNVKIIFFSDNMFQDKNKKPTFKGKQMFLSFVCDAIKRSLKIW